MGRRRHGPSSQLPASLPLLGKLTALEIRGSPVHSSLVGRPWICLSVYCMRPRREADDLLLSTKPVRVILSLSIRVETCCHPVSHQPSIFT